MVDGRRVEAEWQSDGDDESLVKNDLIFEPNDQMQSNSRTQDIQTQDMRGGGMEFMGDGGLGRDGDSRATTGLRLSVRRESGLLHVYAREERSDCRTSDQFEKNALRGDRSVLCKRFVFYIPGHTLHHIRSIMSHETVNENVCVLPVEIRVRRGKEAGIGCQGEYNLMFNVKLPEPARQWERLNQLLVKGSRVVDPLQLRRQSSRRSSDGRRETRNSYTSSSRMGDNGTSSRYSAIFPLT